jgi:hypothetical protein
MRRNLPLLMLQAREQVIGRFRPLLNANGVTEQQWRIVRLLLDTGPLEPNQIGEMCNLRVRVSRGCSPGWSRSVWCAARG